MQELRVREERLAGLLRVRPAYMDEYERKQAELQVLHSQFVDRVRNLEYLEQEIQHFK